MLLSFFFRLCLEMAFFLMVRQDIFSKSTSKVRWLDPRLDNWQKKVVDDVRDSIHFRFIGEYVLIARDKGNREID